MALAADGSNSTRRDGAAGPVGEQRITQILEATARVISARGAANTRLADVAREASVSVGLVQHYFGSKLTLMMAAFRFFNDQWIDGWEAAANSEPDPIKKLVVLLRHSAFEFEQWREVQWRIWIEFWSISSRDADFDALYPEIYERFHAPFRDALTAGVETGAFTIQGTVADVVDRLTAEIDGLRVRVLLQPEHAGAMTPMSRARMLSLLVRSAEEQLGCTLPIAAVDVEHPAGPTERRVTGSKRTRRSKAARGG